MECDRLAGPHMEKSLTLVGDKIRINDNEVQRRRELLHWKQGVLLYAGGGMMTR